MSLKEIYTNLNQKPVISFEVFPPKNDFATNAQKLIDELAILKQFEPAFVSVTYGAGGSNQSNSFDLALKIKNDLDIDVMPHFTCIGATKESVADYLSLVEKNKFKNILALRGDIPQNDPDFVFNEDFKFASDLVDFIKDRTNLSIGVAGYPEIHRECESLEQDLKNLKRKIDAGSDAIITQVFFNNDHYFKFVEKATALGINAPIIPGILPITSLTQIERMVSMCGAEVPQNLIDQLTQVQDDKEAMAKVGIEFAIAQCRELIDSGVAGIHFYTLNKAGATKEVLENVLVKASF